MAVEESIKAIATGNVEALKCLYEEYRIVVYSVALSILRNRQAAEDVLQETFLRVYGKAATYQPGTNIKAWIITIARNLAYDAIRRDKNRRPSDEEELETACTATDNAILLRMELTEALFRLEENERQIVILHIVAGLKHAEISMMLGIPAGTVRWKYRQSLSKLAELMGGDDDGTEPRHIRA